MSSAEQSASGRSSRLRLVDLPRALLRQARLAFGVRGVAWVVGAAVIGLVFGVIAFTLVPMRIYEGAAADKEISEFRAVEDAHLDFMATLAAMATGALEWKPGERPAVVAWRRYTTSLDELCGRID